MPGRSGDGPARGRITLVEPVIDLGLGAVPARPGPPPSDVMVESIRVGRGQAQSSLAENEDRPAPSERRSGPFRRRVGLVSLGDR